MQCSVAMSKSCGRRCGRRLTCTNHFCQLECHTVTDAADDTSVSHCDNVRPSVTLVDQDHIGWKSWKLIARTIRPTPSLFVAQRSSTYSQGNMGKFGGRAGAQKRQYL